MSDVDEAAVAPPTHVGVLLRCFLCHEPLPRPDKSYNYDLHRGWPFESRLNSVYPATGQDGSVTQRLHSTETNKLKASQKSIFPTPNTPLTTHDLSTTECLIEECDNSKLCGDYCPDCAPDRMVYLAHRDCWKVAYSSHNWSSLDWSRLAVQTRPFDFRNWKMEYQLAVCREEPEIPSLSKPLPPIEGPVWTPLGRLLANMRKLPTELQFQITGQLRGTMFASLLQTKRFILEVMPQLPPLSTAWKIQPQIKSLRGVGEEGYDSLSCRLITIMGRSYLSELSLEQLDRMKPHIKIEKKPLRGVQFALGRLGLRGIRIWYEDNNLSPWLGETPLCWIGTILCCDLSSLMVVADELRIIKIEAGQRSQTPQPETSIMWWGDAPTARSQIVVKAFPDKQLHHYQGWKQFQYLPLEFGEVYASGLTVYLSSDFSSVIGLVSHGPTESKFREVKYQRASAGRGVPFHVAFSPGEHLSSAWLHIEPFQFALGQNRGMIVLTTNLGRVHFLGCYPITRHYELEASACVRISTGRPAKIRGLIMNVPELVAGSKDVYPSQRSYRHAPILGVSQDALPPQEGAREIQPPLLPLLLTGPTLPSRCFTYYLRMRRRPFGFSSASLNNISKIYVRRSSVSDEPRGTLSTWCVGLRIVHDDSSIETLGRWDPRDRCSISKLYDGSEGCLRSVSFHMAASSTATFVQRITATMTLAPWEVQPLDELSLVPVHPLTHDWYCDFDDVRPSHPTTRTFDCTQHSQRVAWWFTDSADDISRDHRSSKVPVRFPDGHPTVFSKDPLKTIQMDCDSMAI